MPNLIQLALFLRDPPKADEVADACFHGREIKSLNVQPAQSVAVLDGNLSRKIVSSRENGRIDIIWEPKSEPPILNLEEIDSARLDAEFELVEKLVEKLAVSRVACILSTQREYEDLTDTLSGPDSNFPPISVPSGATEVFYRTNVPKITNGIKLNRLMSIQTANTGFLKIGPAGVLEQEMKEVLDSKIDVNTDHLAKLPDGSAASALKTVREEAMRLLVEGYAKS